MKLIAAALLSLGLLTSSEPMPVPSYNAAGEMLTPAGYREWMFAGSNLGMGYTEEPKKTQLYHNIYLQREAFSHFQKTGTFPEKTILVMDRFEPGTKESINQHGSFNGRHTGIEVAVKDSSRFKESWAYFVFFDANGAAKASAPPEPRGRCWACHKANGSVDNVFVQFYPALRDLAR